MLIVLASTSTFTSSPEAFSARAEAFESCAIGAVVEGVAGAGACVGDGGFGEGEGLGCCASAGAATKRAKAAIIGNVVFFMSVTSQGFRSSVHDE
jgi:hypothetical protein